LGAYTEATGTPLRPALLELYRLRWDLAELAVYVQRFGEPHSDSRDDETSWQELSASIGRLAG